MSKYKSVIKSIGEFVVIFIIMYLIFTLVVIPVKIQGSSMENNLHDGELALVNGLNKKNVDRFDVVIIYSDELDENLIKRVIGLPGETIEYKDDKLYVDGEYVEETFLDESYMERMKSQSDLDYFTEDFEITVGEDEIFVMGDNRLNSYDSRELGCFSYSDIKGKEGIILYPFSEMGWVE